MWRGIWFQCSKGIKYTEAEDSSFRSRRVNTIWVVWCPDRALFGQNKLDRDIIVNAVGVWRCFRDQWIVSIELTFLENRYHKNKQCPCKG